MIVGRDLFCVACIRSIVREIYFAAARAQQYAQLMVDSEPGRWKFTTTLYREPGSMMAGRSLLWGDRDGYWSSFYAEGITLTMVGRAKQYLYGDSIGTLSDIMKQRGLNPPGCIAPPGVVFPDYILIGALRSIAKGKREPIYGYRTMRDYIRRESKLPSGIMKFEAEREDYALRRYDTCPSVTIDEEGLMVMDMGAMDDVPLCNTTTPLKWSPITGYVPYVMSIFEYDWFFQFVLEAGREPRDDDEARRWADEACALARSSHEAEAKEEARRWEDGNYAPGPGESDEEEEEEEEEAGAVDVSESDGGEERARLQREFRQWQREQQAFHRRNREMKEAMDARMQWEAKHGDRDRLMRAIGAVDRFQWPPTDTGGRGIVSRYIRTFIGLENRTDLRPPAAVVAQQPVQTPLPHPDGLPDDCK
jgi:hypothetical protein